MPNDRITRETLDKLQFVQDQLNVFHGLRQLWAGAVASHRPLLVPLDELMRDQVQHLFSIAAAALEAQQTVAPERSPHKRFAYVRPYKDDSEATVVDRWLNEREQAQVAREVAEEVMGWRWVTHDPNDPASGPGYVGDRERYPYRAFIPAAAFQPAAEGPAGAAAASEVIDAMVGHGFWHQIQGAFSPGSGQLSWAGFTPHGVTGWNGRPDHWTGTPNLNLSICLAALAAVRERRQAQEERDAPDNG